MQYQFPIFEDLCPSWGKVTRLGSCKRIPKGTVILGMGAAIDGVYFVEEGILETVLVTHAGPEKVLYRVGRGCVFGEVCCFARGLNQEVFVTARTDCTLYFFTRETIQGPIAREHPALLLEMVTILGHIVRMYGIHLQDSLNLDFFVRVCRYLVYLVRFKAPASEGLQAHVVVESGVTQSDMARLLGVHRVTVSKSVRKLKDMGVLRRFTKRELEISDLPRLIQLSES
jgi:CRP/FNR family transcriptional regulator